MAGLIKDIRLLDSRPMSYNEIVAQVYTAFNGIINQIIVREKEVRKNCNTKKKKIMVIHICLVMIVTSESHCVK